MLSWKQAHEGRLELECKVPDKLFYLLDHEYSKVNLLASSLKGADAGLVAQLAPIAEEPRLRSVHRKYEVMQVRLCG